LQAARTRAPLIGVDPRAQTLDDLWAAVVGVGDHEGKARATGVLIDKPRGILCDRFPTGSKKVGTRVHVRTREGDDWQLPVRRELTDSPFGPVLLEAPERWTPHPVAVDDRPVAIGTKLRAAVFAGERPGISSGVASETTDTSVRIDPVGWVRGLVGLRLATAPGSSGGPVVDASLRLRGFIVAGSTDLRHAKSYMDPAERWYAALSASRPTSRRRAKPR
jgi:hypothetical protein